MAALQGERFSLPADAGEVFPDADAAQGAALLIWAEATATGTLSTSVRSTELRIRVRGDQCQGAPIARIGVDGSQVATAAVPGTSWQPLLVEGSWAAGPHTVRVTFTNDMQAAGCDRNLRLDRVGFATGTAEPPSGNPLEHATFYVDPDSDARKEMARRAGDADAVAALRKIANESNSKWFGDWVATGQIRSEVAQTTGAAAAASSVPVLVVYAIPGRDCGHYSGGGLSGPAAYDAWIRAFADGIGERKAVVVVEPDALAQLDCLSDGARSERLAMIRNATSVLRSAPNAVVYLDAGTSRWIPAAEMANRLTAAGVANTRGFSVNVSNFGYTADEVAFGDDLSQRLGGDHFIVDTSRNGNGPASGFESWCNPQGRALGVRPTATTSSPRADAYLWVKMVGQSDGDCGRGEPSAGTWWPEYAIGLANRAAY